MATIPADLALGGGCDRRLRATRELNMTKYYYYSCDVPDKSRRRAAGIVQSSPINAKQQQQQQQQQHSKQVGQISNPRCKKPSLTSDNLSLNDSTTSGATTSSNDNDTPQSRGNAHPSAVASASHCYRAQSNYMNLNTHISIGQQADKFQVSRSNQVAPSTTCPALIKPEECTTTSNPVACELHMATHGGGSVATSKPTIEEQLKRLFSNDPAQQRPPSQRTRDFRITSRPGYRVVNEPSVRYNHNYHHHHHLPSTPIDHELNGIRPRQTGFCIHHHNLFKSTDRGHLISVQQQQQQQQQQQPVGTTRSDEMSLFFAAARRAANLNNTQADKEARILKWLHDCHQATMRHLDESNPQFV